MPEELLRLENVSSEERGNQLFHNLNISIFKNVKIGIADLWENECSAFARLLAGLASFSQGRLIFHGQKYSAADYNAYAQHSLLKISYISKKAQLVPAMSIAENLFSIRIHSFTSLFNKQAALIRTRQLLQQYQIPLDPDARVSTLSYSQQHLIQIIKALNTGAEIIILDNITSNYTPTEKELLFSTLSKINNCSVVYINNSIDPYFESMDMVIAMKKGRVIRHIFSSDYSSELLTALLIGKNNTVSFSPREQNTCPAQKTVLEIRFPAGWASSKIELKQHEVLGIIDLNGSLYHALNQLELHNNDCSLLISGKRITSYQQAAGQKCFFLTEEHIQNGLFPSLSLKENFTILCSGKTSYLGIIADHLEDHLIATYRSFFQQKSLPLSKWDSIKVMLFRYLTVHPEIVILGINSTDIFPAFQDEFYQIIQLFRKYGTAILMVYVDYAEQISLCDRIITLQKTSAPLSL